MFILYWQILKKKQFFSLGKHSKKSPGLPNSMTHSNEISSMDLVCFYIHFCEATEIHKWLESIINVKKSLINNLCGNIKVICEFMLQIKLRKVHYLI